MNAADSDASEMACQGH